MSVIAIPNWTVEGVLPPIDVHDPTSADRSPYPVTLSDLVLRFNTSPERKAILGGWLGYRAGLHSVGLTTGFQWVDGSFLEDVETIDLRPPKDVDVVTFYDPPNGISQSDLLNRAPDLFDHDKVKATYRVDSYLQSLAARRDRLVRQTAYWYSMWSHRRTQMWKGFLEVTLDPADDANAKALLSAQASERGAL